MANTPITSETLVSFSILTNGQEIKEHYNVISIYVKNAINTISYAKIIFQDGDVSKGEFEISNSSDFTPGNEIVIKLGFGTTNKKVFEGIIVNHNIRLSNGSGQLEVECYDKAIKLTTRRRNTLFQKKKDSDIISQILGTAGLKAKVATTKVIQEQLFQYHASDWDFILARAEANGMVVLNAENEVEVVKPKPTGSSILDLEFGVSVYDFDLGISSYAQVPSVESVAWNIKNQAIESVKSKKPSEVAQGNLKSATLAKVMGNDPYILQSPAPLMKEELQSWADGFVKRAALAKLKGHITFVGYAGLHLNEILEVKGLGSRFNGGGYLSGIEHQVEAGSWKTTCTLGLDNKYATQTYTDLSTLPTGGLLPAVSGLQIGIVTKLDQDPDGQMRIKVKLPTWDAAEQVWARLLLPYASNGSSMFFIPEINDEVAVGFFNDDPRFPVIIGSIHNSKNKAPYEPEAKNNTKAIVTRSKLKIEFDEDKKIITIETPSKNTVILDDDKKTITLKDQNKNMIELSSSGITMDTPKDLTISAKGNVSIDAKQKITMKAGLDFSVEGLNVKHKAKVALSNEGSATAELKASGQVTVKGAIVMIN